jgi:hypothetical protein
MECIQAQEKDFAIWSSAILIYEPWNELEFNLELSNRLEENATMRDESFADIGMEYKKKRYSVGILYRFTNDNNPEKGYDLAHRFGIQFSLKQDWKRFDFSLRNRLQAEYTNPFTSENGLISQDYLRSRMKAAYNIKGIPLKPYASVEYYFGLKTYKPSEAERSRTIVGADYKVTDRQQISMFYVYQNEVNVNRPLNKNILGIEYSYKL